MAFGSRPSEPAFDYYLVLDFEATCDDVVKLKPQVHCTATIRFLTGHANPGLLL